MGDVTADIRRSFDEFVREVEEDPEEKAAIDKARELLRRERGDGDEESYVPAR